MPVWRGSEEGLRRWVKYHEVHVQNLMAYAEHLYDSERDPHVRIYIGRHIGNAKIFLRDTHSNYRSRFHCIQKAESRLEYVLQGVSLDTIKSTLGSDYKEPPSKGERDDRI